uniref:Uncharacterized protein n=1 Tax=Brassica oleracea var. oleracea TaxID=109376 RepID=A0A0D3D3Y9_BRAOL
MKTIGRVDVPQEAFKLEKEGSSAKTGKSPRFGWNKLYWEIYSSPNLGQEKSNQTLADTIILLIGMKFGSLLWIRTSKFHPYCRRETKGTLGMVLEKLDERGMMSEICDAMDLNHLLDREATQHDLSVLDYLSDFVCCLYGKPTAYGVVTLPFSVREGINVFLSGFVPSENLRFRDESLNFKVSDKPQESEGKVKSYAR